MLLKQTLFMLMVHEVVGDVKDSKLILGSTAWTS